MHAEEICSQWLIKPFQGPIVKFEVMSQEKRLAVSLPTFKTRLKTEMF